MEEKSEIRKHIAEKKKEFSDDELMALSSVIMERLEDNVILKCAKTILMYYSLPDEVFTHDFIEKWSKEKTILLPVVKGDELEIKVYGGKEYMKKGSFNIDEPQGEAYYDLTSIDAAIIPGISFDRHGNRLGRGKGYYDRFLKKLNTFKIGVCFGFQLNDEIPHNDHDIVMDEVWTEDGYVSKK
ncbi:5-formyltetrahydrofolate cyclo-ligase [uncultured Bacteroides sp.]|uniref:5-formyltetrahydrofolate cyclo-ligase n=1 Tax=uncultured Bacteroides sp. TaxID=162156 RepID=UPI002618C14D|nr:5-formyltetrahydrofolate cyclo-ligase [uncultured Bacteroides sp.]